jgi:hypothetical protein
VIDGLVTRMLSDGRLRARNPARSSHDVANLHGDVIYIAFGIIIPFFSIVFRLFLVNSIEGLYDYRSLFELGSVAGLLFFYWGNIKYLEK